MNTAGSPAKQVGQTPTQLGRYRIERELGRGAMGVVYKAFDPVVERPLAIKTIRLDVSDPEELARRLRREAKSVGQLEHPNIVTLYDAGECEGMFYLAMQYLEGESLWARMQRQQPFSLKETQEILRQISSALDYAHQHGVIHRDVKPANIIVTAENVVKLTDFGIAKVLDATTQTAGFIVGTPSYMSPEQALGRPLDGRSDIFSLGTILYELLTGEKAFPGQNVTTVIYKIVHETPSPITAMRPDLCAELEPVVKKSLAKNPGERFQSCAELQMHLDKALASAAPVVASVDKAKAIIEAHSISSSPASASAAAGTASAPASESGARLVVPSARVLSPWWGVGALGALLLALLVLVALRFKPLKTVAIPPKPPPGAIKGASRSAGESSPAGGAAAAEQPLAGVPREAAGVGLPAQAQRGAKAGPSRAQSVRPSEVKQVAPKAAAASAPETFDSLLIEGDMAFQSSQYGRALDAYRRAYQIKSNNSEVRRKIATTLTLLGRAEEAQKYQ